jgi:hypothetical protein
VFHRLTQSLRREKLLVLNMALAAGILAFLFFVVLS